MSQSPCTVPIQYKLVALQPFLICEPVSVGFTASYGIFSSNRNAIGLQNDTQTAAQVDFLIAMRW
jgi:hypothetical protein